MGICMSSNNEEAEQKKKSQQIDKQLEEDSKRLRKECKILLLGAWSRRRTLRHPILIAFSRLGRERQVNNRQADEDHTSERIFRRRAVQLQADRI